MLPIDERKAEDFLHETFGVKDSHISNQVLEDEIFPHLEERCECPAGSVTKQSSMVLVEIKEAVQLVPCASDLICLRAASRRACTVAREMFVYEFCCLLEAVPIHVGADSIALALGKLSEKSNMRVLQSILALLESESCKSWKVAMDVLQDLASDEKGFIEVMLHCLEHRSVYVREVSLTTLAQLVRRGDGRSLRSIAGKLTDSHCGVRVAAIKAMAKVAVKSDQEAIQLVCFRTQDRELAVRAACESFLSEVAKGDKGTIKLFSEQLKHADLDARVAAIRGLTCVAIEGDAEVLQWVTQLLGSDQPLLRRAAIHALPSLAATGDKRICKALASRLKDVDQTVREAAIKALSHTAQRGDRAAAAVFCKCLEESSGHAAKDLNLRIQKLEALGQITDPGDARVVRCIINFMKQLGSNSADCDVRIVATKVVGQLATQTDREVVHHLQQVRDQMWGSYTVRQKREAESALVGISNRHSRTRTWTPHCCGTAALRRSIS
eukprot:TRINITY_DN76478_c0_g1_i1.p1 TRINITY_DN76478_c0_g1~~TRINITY_DN76478_c0_g1_i1.p1  ORF type:complete len:558 (-),score=81.43 TRINITY_DN76478_c0_g1_i1:5-1492(-)